MGDVGIKITRPVMYVVLAILSASLATIYYICLTTLGREKEQMSPNVNVGIFLWTSFPIMLT